MAGEDGGLGKWITVGKLKKLLSKLNDDDELTANSMENISVFRPISPDKAPPYGFIDILFERLEVYGDGDADYDDYDDDDDDDDDGGVNDVDIKRAESE